MAFGVWKGFTTFGGSEVILADQSGYFSGVPLATQDATDLDVWAKTIGTRSYDEPRSRDQLVNAGRIIVLGEGVKARLLWEQGNIAHIKLTTGVSAGTEGVVSKYNSWTRKAEGEGMKPLHPVPGMNAPFG